MLMVIVMITGEFLSMSLTADLVRPSATSNSWNIGRITSAAIVLGGCFLAFCLRILLVGKFKLKLDIAALRALSVVAIVFGSQATIYAMQDRQRLWGLSPSVWLVSSSIADVLIISALATLGIAMSSLPIWVVGGEFAAAVVFGILLDLIMVPVFGMLRIS
jgi:H+-transporting ATPase